MTTTEAAAGNGSTTTTAETASGPAVQPERATGMAQVREAETYYAASVMNEAVSQAERLSGVIYRAISDAYFKEVRRSADNAGRTAAQTADSPEIRARAQEALDCLDAARHYVRRLLAGPEPPF